MEQQFFYLSDKLKRNQMISSVTGDELTSDQLYGDKDGVEDALFDQFEIPERPNQRFPASKFACNSRYAVFWDSNDIAAFEMSKGFKHVPVNFFVNPEVHLRQ